MKKFRSYRSKPHTKLFTMGASSGTVKTKKKKQIQPDKKNRRALEFILTWAEVVVKQFVERRPVLVDVPATTQRQINMARE